VLLLLLLPPLAADAACFHPVNKGGFVDASNW